MNELLSLQTYPGRCRVLALEPRLVEGELELELQDACSNDRIVEREP